MITSLSLIQPRRSLSWCSSLREEKLRLASDLAEAQYWWILIVNARCKLLQVVYKYWGNDCLQPNDVGNIWELFAKLCDASDIFPLSAISSNTLSVRETCDAPRHLPSLSHFCRTFECTESSDATTYLLCASISANGSNIFLLSAISSSAVSVRPVTSSAQ